MRNFPKATELIMGKAGFHSVVTSTAPSLILNATFSFKILFIHEGQRQRLKEKLGG